MKRAWSVVSFIAVVNLMTIILVLGWAWITGKVDADAASSMTVILAIFALVQLIILVLLDGRSQWLQCSQDRRARCPPGAAAFGMRWQHCFEMIV